MGTNHKPPRNEYMCVHIKSLQSCMILCDPMDCSPPGSSVHGILQARILEWLAMPSSRGSSQPRDRACISRDSCVAGRFFTTESPGKPQEWIYFLLKYGWDIFICNKIYIWSLSSGSTNPWNFLSVETLEGVFCYVNKVTSESHLRVGAGHHENQHWITEG